MILAGTTDVLGTVVDVSGTVATVVAGTVVAGALFTGAGAPALVDGAVLAGDTGRGDTAVRCAAEPHELAVITSTPPRATR